MCGYRDILFLSHKEKVNSSKYLNESSKLHLNFNGVKVFEKDFPKVLKKFD